MANDQVLCDVLAEGVVVGVNEEVDILGDHTSRPRGRTIHYNRTYTFISGYSANFSWFKVQMDLTPQLEV